MARKTRKLLYKVGRLVLRLCGGREIAVVCGDDPPGGESLLLMRGADLAAAGLLGEMNPTAARDFLRACRRSNIHLYPDDWKKLPVPDVPAEEQAPIVELVDQILAAKRVGPAADVSALEAEIDRLVNQLYGLATEGTEISEEATVEGG